jgi:multidrug efflux pump subunit AcrA (membrane-fusion protein)
MAERNNAGSGGPAPAGKNGGPGMDAAQSAGTQTVFSVRTAGAERRTLQAYIEVNGNVAAGDQIAVLPSMEGKLVSMKAGLGSIVQKDQLLAEVDPSLPGKTYSLSPVYAPISGIVISTPSAEGSTVTKTSSLMTIAVAGSIRIEAQIPEREIGQLKNGLKAAVTLEAFPGETFPAVITQVSPVVDISTRTKKVILAFDQADARINPGMFARLRLSTRTYQNVVTVPSGAITEIRGQQGVYVHERDVVRFAEVETGVTVDGETEIRRGVEEGERVVIQGQQFLSDGARVKVIGG